jgi:hypothetical protein
MKPSFRSFLKKAGYPAYLYETTGKEKKIVVFKDKDLRWYVMETGSSGLQVEITGPYRSEQELMRDFPGRR